jgi:Tfp pilus assembly protein PilP
MISGRLATNRMIVSKTIIVSLIMGIFYLYGCSDTPPISTSGNATSSGVAKGVVAEPVVSVSETALDEPTLQAGYIYDRRNRRDPFSPLISPVRKLKEKDASKLGTLEGYDLGEFRLSAIANRGNKYFALLITPDNRSFTVNKGNIIGLNRGKIKKISSDEVVLVEYTKNYKGELKPREIILEFHKGETN